MRKKHVVFPTFLQRMMFLKHWLFHVSIKRSDNGQSVIRLCTIMRYSCALFPYFTVVIFFFFLCCTFFMLYSFHVALFHTAPFPCRNFCIVIFSCYNFCLLHSFMHGSISCCTFTHCNVFFLHSFHVALFACCNFSCCTFLMLHYFQKCSQYPHKNLRRRALQQ